MASIAYKAYKNKKIKLFPLKPTRDFVYIEDVVNSNLQSFDALTGVYEVGTGESNTFETLEMKMKDDFINYFPMVTLQNLNVLVDEEYNRIKIELYYYISDINTVDNITLTF